MIFHNWKEARALLLVCALLAAMLSGCAAPTVGTVVTTPATTTTAGLGAGELLRIDGHPVAVEEFQLFLQDERARTAAHFFKEYAAEVEAGFWEKEFDGQTPNEYARAAALAQLTRAKMEAILLKERGLVESISYAALLTDMEKTNAEHAEKLETGEVFYGISVYDAATYSVYLRAQRWGELRASQADYSAPTQQQMRAVYDENPSFFVPTPVYTCTFSYPDGTVERREVSAETVHKEDADGAALLEALEGLAVGETLPNRSMDGKSMQVTLTAVARGARAPFEDAGVQTQLVAICEEQELYALVSARVAAAELITDAVLYAQQTLG